MGMENCMVSFRVNSYAHQGHSIRNPRIKVAEAKTIGFIFSGLNRTKILYPANIMAATSIHRSPIENVMPVNLAMLPSVRRRSTPAEAVKIPTSRGRVNGSCKKMRAKITMNMGEHIAMSERFRA